LEKFTEERNTMSSQRFSSGAVLAVFGLLVLGAAESRAQQTLGALSGYTTGSQIDRRPVVPVTAYSTSTYVPGTFGTYGSLASPIFMTTINTPGIYGAYSYGVAPLTFNREPTFYPVYNPRLDIPAITTTIAPVVPTSNIITAGTVTWGPVPTTTTAVARATVPANSTADVTVWLPADAKLYFEGILMDLTGPERHFVTPLLVPKRNYQYDVRAVWNDNQGREVVQDRQVLVHAGDRLNVDFRSPAPNPTLRTRQLPVPPVPDTKAKQSPASPRQEKDTK
jgi:uncharacterized protein (TIGR03000 family)